MGIDFPLTFSIYCFWLIQDLTDYILSYRWPETTWEALKENALKEQGSKGNYIAVPILWRVIYIESHELKTLLKLEVAQDACILEAYDMKEA